MTTIIYIAGPMTGLPDSNYPAFHQAAGELRGAGYDVLNPVVSGRRRDAPRRGAGQVEGATWSDYMRNGLNQLVRADGIALLPGWHRSRGACIESNIARELDITSGTVDDWLRRAYGETWLLDVIAARPEGKN